uniref:Uncharacterized protein n=1 Tax=Arundo donax TaxID=35708 RepID=A0A0A9GC30_ARUDO
MPVPLISHLMWLRIMLPRPIPHQHLEVEKNATNQSRGILHHQQLSDTDGCGHN